MYRVQCCGSPGAEAAEAPGDPDKYPNFEVSVELKGASDTTDLNPTNTEYRWEHQMVGTIYVLDESSQNLSIQRDIFPIPRSPRDLPLSVPGFLPVAVSMNQ